MAVRPALSWGILINQNLHNVKIPAEGINIIHIQKTIITNIYYYPEE